MKTHYRVLIISAVLTLAGCGSPQDEFRKAISKFGYIPFELPMPETRVGTIVRGNAREMSMFARPEKCFPDLGEGNSLRWVQATDLPNQYKSVTFNFDADANAVLGAGNPVIKFKTNISYVKTVSLTFKGASVEFLDEFNFQDYYRSRMNDRCKEVLKAYPFIFQALHITEMEFVFRNEAGVKINLNAQVVKDILDIQAGVDWSYSNIYTLKVSSPKYIGYRLGKVDSNGLVTTQASKADSKGNWIFKPAALATASKLSPITDAEVAAPLR